ncbi:hypothetical protein J2W69_003999 [Rheinheimera soli]|uniref:DUF2798 domain-containing protein n=1 Tax=Rheinheimera soli TaxID=443616 RepID=A0ABU1W4W8_9GAMM|nr:hypothetical protein [Rheinheimera soli]
MLSQSKFEFKLLFYIMINTLTLALLTVFLGGVIEPIDNTEPSGWSSISAAIWHCFNRLVLVTIFTYPIAYFIGVKLYLHKNDSL